ncbi:MAG TPA: rhodanese-like domain-containing protein [Gemmatimonadales bacterium]
MSRLPAVLGPDALATARERDPEIRLLDVRTATEFAGGHIDGSYNVPLDRLGAYVGELRAVDAPIVLVCRSGARARAADAMLREAGLRDLHILDGGVLAWRSAGHPVYRAAGATGIALRRAVGMAAIVAAFVIGGSQPLVAILFGFVGLRMALGLPVLPCAAAGTCSTGVRGGDDTAATVRACAAGIPPAGAPSNVGASGS